MLASQVHRGPSPLYEAIRLRPVELGLNKVDDHVAEHITGLLVIPRYVVSDLFNVRAVEAEEPLPRLIALEGACSGKVDITEEVAADEPGNHIPSRALTGRRRSLSDCDRIEMLGEFLEADSEIAMNVDEP